MCVKRRGTKFICIVPEGAKVIEYFGKYYAADPESEAKILANGNWVKVPMILNTTVTDRKHMPEEIR